MKKFKKQKGITLVALIITIVVLLILAAVAIGAVRDSDIVGYAQNAASGYNQAKANEIDLLAQYESKIESVLSKEKVYSYTEDNQTFYIKLTADKQIIFDFPDVEGSGTYEYVNVTSEVITQNISSGMPTDVESYSSRVVKGIVDGDEGILLLSKDEKILYLSGVPFTLVEEDNESITSEPSTSEWTTYGTDEYYFLVGEQKSYAIVNGAIYDDWTCDITEESIEEHYSSNTTYSTYTVADQRLQNSSKILVLVNKTMGDHTLLATISDQGNELYICSHNSAENTFIVRRCISC